MNNPRSDTDRLAGKCRKVFFKAFPKHSRRHQFFVHFLLPLASLIVFVASWELLVLVFRIKSYVIPRPSVLFRIFSANSMMFLEDAGITLAEALCGYFLGSLIGFSIAVLFAHSRLAERTIYPYFVAIQAMPLVAIAPLLVLWFGYGAFSKIIMASLVCFFPMVVNITLGLKSIEPDALNLMRILKANTAQVFFKLRLPNSMPFVMSGLKISATLSVIGAIVAEMSGATKGIGFRMIVSVHRSDTEVLFVAIILASALGIGLFKTIAWIEKKALFWHVSTK